MEMHYLCVKWLNEGSVPMGVTLDTHIPRSEFTNVCVTCISKKTDRTEEHKAESKIIREVN